MRETTRQRLAFNLYVELGPGRSLEALHAELARDPSPLGAKRAPGLRSLYRWSASFHWQDRIADLEREARRRDGETLLTALREMNRRQAAEGLRLQSRAMERLESLDLNAISATETIRALVEGARLERLASGEVTDRAGIEKGEEIDLIGFSIAELRALAEIALSHAKGDRQPHGKPRGLEPGLPPDQGPTDGADPGDG
jgi:hypothetical protein